ncbi:MAG: DUF4127 family protein [Candidatus Sericytochromatia bacterium]|nr:DUF4127 family protein [Candidatus Sericytochromatia bacterium]
MRHDRKKWVLLPLDGRPCTRALPAAIGCAGGLDLVVPPLELLGDLDRPADPERVWVWLEEACRGADGAVIALDTLVHGGLVPARRSFESAEVLCGRLARLRELSCRVLGFAVTMRIPDSTVADEEPAWWANYGPQVHRWSSARDRYDVTGDPGALEEALAARAAVPDELAEEFLARRARNFEVHLAAMDLVRDGVLELLCLTQDDCTPFGFNQAEKRRLEGLAPPGVLIYPGADEVASVLVGHVLLEGQAPALALEAWPPEGGDIVAMYEDRPLVATAAGQIRALGARLAPADEAVACLILNAPAVSQGDLALGLGLEGVNARARPLEALRDRLAERTTPLILADVAYANGGDSALWRQGDEGPGFDPMRLAGLAAWNTAGNTIGTALAMWAAWRTGPADEEAWRALMAERLADDVLYQGWMRQQWKREGLDLSMAAAKFGSSFRKRFTELFPTAGMVPVGGNFPWRRWFEAEILLRPSAAD